MILHFVIFVLACVILTGHSDRIETERFLLSDEKSILYKSYWGIKQSNDSSLTANLSNPGILKADDDVPNKLSQNSRKINKLGHNNELNPKENKLSTAQSDQVTQPRRRRLRKRKRKKQRRLKNKLDVTTAKTDLPKNLTLDDLIQKINENPEVNLNSLESEAFNKTLTYHAETNKTENRYINLTLDLGRTSRRCRMRKGGCSQICRAKGVPKCACYHGYTLDKDMRTCLDIDECKTNNGGCQSICTNNPGSFECSCNEGFRLGDDGKSCVDVNECLRRNGHGFCDDICHNTHGSYTCSCRPGTTLGADGHSCFDVDECVEGNAGCSHICINTINGPFCSCPDGMELSSDWKTCQDINECEEEIIKKSCKDGCVNTEGSYKCLDYSMYQNDKGSQIATCKPIFPPKLGYIKCSRTNAVKLFGKNGRRRVVNSPGTTCSLVCPQGYMLKGQFLVVCGFDRNWEGIMDGYCKHSPPPTLKCPEDQTFEMSKESNSMIVRFPAPVTNVRQKYVKSSPKWARRLIGKLGVGRHLIRFDVVDPQTKLSAFCYFTINVNQYSG